MSDNISRTKSAILSLNSPGKGAAKSASHTPRTQTVSFFAKGGAVRFERGMKDKVKTKKISKMGDKKKVMGTVGEAKKIIAALKRPAVGTVPTPMGGGMPMKKGGKAKKKC